MWHTYYSGHFWGMHWIWWIFWVIIFFWIFATPYDFPEQRIKKDSPLDILKKRFARGEINKEEFEQKKKLIQQ